jgi:hypothetical protein
MSALHRSLRVIPHPTPLASPLLRQTAQIRHARCFSHPTRRDVPRRIPTIQSVRPLGSRLFATIPFGTSQVSTDMPIHVDTDQASSHRHACTGLACAVSSHVASARADKPNPVISFLTRHASSSRHRSPTRQLSSSRDSPNLVSPRLSTCHAPPRRSPLRLRPDSPSLVRSVRRAIPCHVRVTPTRARTPHVETTCDAPTTGQFPRSPGPLRSPQFALTRQVAAHLAISTPT